MAIINAIKNDNHPAWTLYHAPGEQVSKEQLMAEGQAYAKEIIPGKECLFATHHDAIDGDHVHIVIKQRQFEYVDVLYWLKDRPKVPKFVTILDEFEHHYTGTKFYRVRIEYSSYITENYPVVEYETLKESQLIDMLVKRRTDNGQT